MSPSNGTRPVAFTIRKCRKSSAPLSLTPNQWTVTLALGSIAPYPRMTMRRSPTSAVHWSKPMASLTWWSGISKNKDDNDNVKKALKFIVLITTPWVATIVTGHFFTVLARLTISWNDFKCNPKVSSRVVSVKVSACCGCSSVLTQDSWDTDTPIANCIVVHV